MSDLLIDTHALAWSLVAPDYLTNEARNLLQNGVTILVRQSSFHEIALKVRNGKWDEMVPYVPRLDSLCSAQGFQITNYTGRTAILSGSKAWEHRDLFDRMIAAIAIEMNCPLISKDAAFDGLDGFPGWCGRIWAQPEPATSES